MVLRKYLITLHGAYIYIYITMCLLTGKEKMHYKDVEGEYCGFNWIFEI